MSIRARQVLIVVIGLCAFLAMIFMGLWQMSVYRSQGAEAIMERASGPPESLAEAVESSEGINDLFGRQVSIEGRYIDKSIYIGVDFPVRVAQAFETPVGTLVIVRGDVDDSNPPPKPPEGRLTQTGVLLPPEGDPGLDVSEDLPPETLSSMRVQALAQDWPGPLIPAYLTLNADESRSQGLEPATVPLPEGEGSARNRGYAVQWWAFAAFAMVMTVVWARQAGRQPATNTSVTSQESGD